MFGNLSVLPHQQPPAERRLVKWQPMEEILFGKLSASPVRCECGSPLIYRDHTVADTVPTFYSYRREYLCHICYARFTQHMYWKCERDAAVEHSKLHNRRHYIVCWRCAPALYASQLCASDKSCSPLISEPSFFTVLCIARCMASSPSHLVALRLVNKTYAAALEYGKPGVNKLWEKLCRLRWPSISGKLRVSRWDKMYLFRKWRINALSYAHPDNAESYQRDESTIENCAFGVPEKDAERAQALPKGYNWSFRCPLASYLLDRVKSSKGVLFCDECQRNVYLCSNEAEVSEHVSQERCVAIDFDGAWDRKAHNRWFATSGLMGLFDINKEHQREETEIRNRY